MTSSTPFTRCSVSYKDYDAVVVAQAGDFQNGELEVLAGRFYRHFSGFGKPHHQTPPKSGQSVALQHLSHPTFNGSFEGLGASQTVGHFRIVVGFSRKALSAEQQEIERRARSVFSGNGGDG